MSYLLVLYIIPLIILILIGKYYKDPDFVFYAFIPCLNIAVLICVILTILDILLDSIKNWVKK